MPHMLYSRQTQLCNCVRQHRSAARGISSTALGNSSLLLPLCDIRQQQPTIRSDMQRQL